MRSLGKVTDVFLQPGEFFVGDASYRIRTLLGSCVSITLWHAEKRIGAMSHFLLPSRRQNGLHTLDARYGDEALTLMIKEMKQFGIKADQCVAKVFGGGNMFGKDGGEAPQVGKKNGESARQLLDMHNIPLVSESLYGNGHRKIIFNIANGDVWARQMKPNKLGRTDFGVHS